MLRACNKILKLYSKHEALSISQLKVLSKYNTETLEHYTNILRKNGYIKLPSPDDLYGVKLTPDTNFNITDAGFEYLEKLELDTYVKLVLPSVAIILSLIAIIVSIVTTYLTLNVH